MEKIIDIKGYSAEKAFKLTVLKVKGMLLSCMRT